MDLYGPGKTGGSAMDDIFKKISGGGAMDIYAPPKATTGGSAMDDIFKKIKGGSGPAARKDSSGGGLVGDLSKLAVPLGLIAAKEGMEYLAKKRSDKKAAKKSVGGGLVADMANLAIPLGFVAAERVLSSQLSKRDGKKGKKSPDEGATKKKPAAPKRVRGRVAAYGGDGEYGTDAMPQMGGFADLMPLHAQQSGGSDSFFDTIVHTLPKKTSGGSGDIPELPMSGGRGGRIARQRGGSGDMDPMMPPTTIGGSGDMDMMPPTTIGGGRRGSNAAKDSPSTMAARHAAIAAEFRNMAAEIGSFLEKKALGGKGKTKTAVKPKTTGKPKTKTVKGKGNGKK